ncbi:hypothetical protein CISIN_1g044888mg, partial [Citrus sinensis]
MWRLKICIGAARGLHYLRTGTRNIIIHRDVKSTNILLDENWVAKVSDLGLAKVGPNMLTLCCYQSGTLGLVVDPFLRGKIDPGCFKTFTDIAKKCLADRGCDRPQMGDVLCNLGLAWRQQGAVDHYIQEDIVSTCGHPYIANINGNCNSDMSPW